MTIYGYDRGSIECFFCLPVTEKRFLGYLRFLYYCYLFVLSNLIAKYHVNGYPQWDLRVWVFRFFSEINGVLFFSLLSMRVIFGMTDNFVIVNSKRQI